MTQGVSAPCIPSRVLLQTSLSKPKSVQVNLADPLSVLLP